MKPEYNIFCDANEAVAYLKSINAYDTFIDDEMTDEEFNTLLEKVKSMVKVELRDR